MADNESVQNRNPRMKYALILVLYVGYSMHTYSRRVFQNVINYVLGDGLVDPRAIGFIVSSQQIGYTISKFTHPFIIDIPDPKWTFCATMFTSCGILLLFSSSSTVKMLSTLYWTNGFCLAFAWPSLAKLLKQAIPPDEFGFWWSIECTSSNVGAILCSLISTILSERAGWRNSVRFCCLLNLICGLFCVFVFLFAELPMPRKEQHKKATAPSQSGIMFYVFNPVLLANGFSFFTIYLCRYLVSDWYQIYLKTMGFPQIAIASFISSMELGGTIGSVFAGICADFCFNKLNNWKNPRLFVIIICSTVVTFLQHVMISMVTETTSHVILSVLGFSYGFFIYGPVAISGIIAIEAAPQEKQGLTFSVNVLYANVAMLVAGYPLSTIGATFGWKQAFVFCYVLLATSTFCVILVRTSSTPIDVRIRESILRDEVVPERLSHRVSDWSSMKKIRTTDGVD